jgi:membrane protein implicated in regulation of membrane protease activity
MLLVLAILAAIFLLPSPWDYLVVIAAAVVEAGEVAFFIRYSRRRRATTGAEALPGTIGTVVEPCHPLGQIRVLGELWSARCDEGADPGDKVVVDSLDPDLTLIVHRAPI